jgi:DNA polymerase
MKILRIDFETYSEVPLNGKESVGVWNYANHSSTQVLMLSYKMPGSTIVEQWFPYLGPMPEVLKATLLDSEIMLSAFNSAFERYILQFVLGITVAINRFIDPQVSARYLSMPGDLDEVSDILGLPEHLAKDKRGDELVKLFCEPQLSKKKRGEEQTYFKADWTTHPEQWKAFCEYGAQDIVAEEEVSRREEILGALPLPPFERKLWEFDQKVNDRGMPVDAEFVKKAYALALRSKKEALDKQNAITGLENANSTDQLKPWLKARGYPFNTLRKETVDSVLKDPEVKLTPEAREVLKARREASSTSYQKLSAIMRQISPDGRLRGQFIFLGSPRAGRWAGNAVQLHNMARPAVVGEVKDKDGVIIEKGYDFEDLDVVRDAREMILREDYDGIKAKYKSVLLVVKSLIRTAFKAPEGYRFNVCDLNAIETRVGGWLAGCTSLMDVFIPLPGKPNGRDPYLDFASRLYGIPYEKLAADYSGVNGKEAKAAAKRMRQIAKPGVLAAIFRQSGGGWGHSKKGYKDHGDDCNANDTYTEQNGKVKKVGKKYCACETIYDKIKTGLWGYGEGMGIEMTQEQAQMSVRIFREVYKEIPECWYAIEDAVADVLKHQDTTRRIGPGGCIVIDKINIEGRHPLMRVKLPSGRYLHYLDARLESCKMPWLKDGEEVYRDTLVYAGLNQDTKQWDIWVQSHGGKLFENWIQAIARCVFAAKLLAFESNDIPVVGHSHDEGISLVPNDPFSPGVADMVKLMSIPETWAPDLRLGADGFEDFIYHK